MTFETVMQALRLYMSTFLMNHQELSRPLI